MGYVFPGLSVLVGLYWAVKAFGYKLWVLNGPGGGLFPLIAGILAIVFGIVLIVRRYRMKEKSDFSIKSVFPVLGVVGIIIASYIIGLIPALGAFIISWMVFYEKERWGKSLMVGIGTAVVLWLIFDLWLAVPLPMGVFGLF